MPPRPKPCSSPNRYISFILLIIISTNCSTYCYQLTTEAGSKEEVAEREVPVPRIKTESMRRSFWSGYTGEEHVTKLNSDSLSKFISQHNESLIMFYANWCSSSKESAKEFAKVALDMAYTEGFSHIQFGALDCNGTQANKIICNKSYGIIKYPRFLYFRNGKYDRMYTTWCPNHADFFYSWIVYGGNDKYCSGSGSSEGLHSSVPVPPKYNNQNQAIMILSLTLTTLVSLISM